jgi:outer membrane lipoprotein SlyB
MPSPLQIRNFFSAFVISSCMVGSAHAQSQTREGAALGGIAGAVIGGIVGHQNDEVAEGALIGGAVGAITGGVIGNARQKAQQQQVYAPPPPTVYRSNVQTRTSVPYYTSTTTVPGRKPVSIADVITMTRSGVNDGVILNQIHTNGVISNPEVNEVVLMSQQGVSNVVITAMQQANVGSGAAVTTYATAPSTVIVEETAPVIVTRPVYQQPVYIHHHRAPQPYYYRRGF